MKPLWALYVKGEVVPDYTLIRVLEPNEEAQTAGPDAFLETQAQMLRLGLMDKPNAQGGKTELALQTAKTMRLVIVQPSEELIKQLKRS
jgi:hypothetical protein